jgi:hypothetical protein
MSSAVPKSQITVAELKDELEKLGVDFKSNDRKDTLYNKYKYAMDKKKSPKGKSPKKASPSASKRYSPGDKKPLYSPNDYNVDDIVKGQDGTDYIVAVNKAGNKFWRSCKAKIAKCDEKGTRKPVVPKGKKGSKVKTGKTPPGSPKTSSKKKSTPKKSTPKKSTPKKSTPKGSKKVASSLTEEQLASEYERLNALGVSELKDEVSNVNPDYLEVYRSETGEKKAPVKYQLINYVLTGKFGTERRRSPKKAPADLIKDAKKRARTPSKKSSKKKSGGKKLSAKKSTPKKDKGKEPLIEGDVVPKGYDVVGNKLFSGWTVIGDPEKLYTFMKTNNSTVEELAQSIQEKVVGENLNIVRFEQDPLCDEMKESCGQFVICMEFASSPFTVSQKMTGAGYIDGILIAKPDAEEMNVLENKADFYCKGPVIAGTLSALFDAYFNSKTMKGFMSKFTSKNALIHKFDSGDQERLYVVKVPASETTNFTKIIIERMK